MKRISKRVRERAIDGLLRVAANRARRHGVIYIDDVFRLGLDGNTTAVRDLAMGAFQGHRQPVCAHCQEAFNVTDGSMVAHVRACPKNPMVQRIAALEKMLNAAADYIDSVIGNDPDGLADRARALLGGGQ